MVGGGPAGLMAADVLIRAGHQVTLHERMGSVGRKFLLAGKGGLNLTHSETGTRFRNRFGSQEPWVSEWLDEFDSQAVITWAASLGVETFSGSSGRIFPKDLKAAPLLRRWVRRLRSQGVRFAVNHRWVGWSRNAEEDIALAFETIKGPIQTCHDSVVFALGGASWPILGSDGSWQSAIRSSDISVKELLPSNCGFDLRWSEHFLERFEGHPVKPVSIDIAAPGEKPETRQGEFVITKSGVEGSLIYALSARLRERLIEEGAPITIHVDLVPEASINQVSDALARPRKGRSISEHLRRTLKLEGVKRGLLFEQLGPADRNDLECVAKNIKRLPLRMYAARPVAEAISSAGGIKRESLNDQLMSVQHPGLFFAGEMLDWEAPTGGYLLTACLSSGARAGIGVNRWLLNRP